MMGVEKRHVARGEKNNFQKGGGGINIVFGPKCRLLHRTQYIYSTTGGNCQQLPVPDVFPHGIHIGHKTYLVLH
jgi:hypothetical protein